MSYVYRCYVEEVIWPNSKFITDGCGPSTASGSAVTEMAKGKTIEDALMIDANAILAVLDGLPEESIHCPVLAVNTLRAAIEDYKNT